MSAAARRTFDAEFREPVGIDAWQRLLSELAAARQPPHERAVRALAGPPT